MSGVDVLAIPAGVLLLATLLRDVFSTVFVPGGRPGPLTAGLYRHVWRAWRAASRRLRADRPRPALALAGPSLLPLTIAMWALLLVVAFALIYLPGADDFRSSSGGRPPTYLTALYFSAYSATTLGVGDVYPTDGLLRLLSVAEAGMGFALFGVATTYLLSVYSALQRSTSLALEISRYLQSDADPLETLISLIRNGQEKEVAQWFAGVSSRLAEAAQAQQQYPVLEYFHVPDDDRALPVALERLLEVLTVCLALLEPEHHPALSRSRAAAFAFTSAVAHSHDRAAQLRTGDGAPAIDDAARLRQYEHTRAELTAAGIRLRPDAEARSSYVELRRRWDRNSAAVVEHYGYGPP